MVFRFHSLQVFFLFCQSDFFKKKNFHMKKKKLVVKLNWQPLLLCQIIQLPNSLQASKTCKLSQCRNLYFENCKSKNCQVKQSNCPISLEDSYDAIDYQVIMIDFWFCKIFYVYFCVSIDLSCLRLFDKS